MQIAQKNTKLLCIDEYSKRKGVKNIESIEYYA